MTAPELLALRTRKGWTQEDLAYALGVSLSTVQRWESGKVTISTINAIAIRAKLA